MRMNCLVLLIEIKTTYKKFSISNFNNLLKRNKKKERKVKRGLEEWVQKILLNFQRMCEKDKMR